MRLRRRSADTAASARLFAMPLVAHIALVIVLAVAVAIVLGFGLWWGIGRPTIATGKPWEAKDSFDFVKIVLAVVGGIGAVVALVVSYRKQRLGEDAERRQTAAEVREDARLFGEDFARATDQLGSAEAPVRLASMYTLERLGQTTPHQQQTIVNVLCAYLRMPYSPPEAEPAEEHRQEDERRKHEREVRLTAQRILATNLRTSAAKNQNWEGINLDFTGATLIEFDFSNCETHDALFVDVSFNGDAWFEGVQFHGDARFEGAQFCGAARFEEAQFRRGVRFEAAQFCGDVRFEEAQFHDDARFRGANFDGDAWFEGAQFNGTARFRVNQFRQGAEFRGVQFHRNAWFEGARFHGDARFEEVQFSGDGWFGGVRFDGDAWFGGARFQGDARFEEVQISGEVGFVRAYFSGTARFDEAQFNGIAEFMGAQFRGDAEFSSARVRLDVSERILNGRAWPRGYDVSALQCLEDMRNSGNEERWGFLVRTDPDGKNSNI